MASKSNNLEDLNLSDADLGLEDDSTVVTPVVIENENVKKANEAMQTAAATAALKAAINANSELATKEAEKTYIIEKKKFMLNKCKTDEAVEFVGLKLYANYFGPVYTFLYNGIPVTVKFDGSKQTFPRFIYDKIMQKINEVSDANTNKVEIEYRNA